MAISGAEVVVSDTEDMAQLLCMNIEANRPALQTSSGKPIGSISAYSFVCNCQTKWRCAVLSAGSIAHCVLPWGTSLRYHAHGPHNLHPDYIVGSDITYDEGCYLPLLQTIAAYVWGNPHVRVRHTKTRLC